MKVHYTVEPHSTDTSVKSSFGRYQIKPDQEGIGYSYATQLGA